MVLRHSQRARDIEQMLTQCWASVVGLTEPFSQILFHPYMIDVAANTKKTIEQIQRLFISIITAPLLMAKCRINGPVRASCVRHV